MKSFGNRLAMCPLMVLSLAGVANAAQVIVFEAPQDIWRQEVSAEFAANRELGRAWVDVQLESTNSGGEESPEREVISRAVEGLYYDPARKQVLYRTATEAIVCAEDASFFWTTYLKSTGRCLLTPLSEQRKEDDGFKIRERTVTKVVFEAQTSSTAQRAAASKKTTSETRVEK